MGRSSDKTLIEGAEDRPSTQRQAQYSLVLYHRDGAKVVALEEGASLVVGRTPPADIIVPDLNVSRQHARFTREQDTIWVEDLQSTNRTRVDGKAIEKTVVRPGQEVLVGPVAVSIHSSTSREGLPDGLSDHDRFIPSLEREVVRSRTFGRPVSLVMLRSLKRDSAHVRHWLDRIRSSLRQVDAIALYAPGTLEVVLPEMTTADAERLARKWSVGDPRLACGVAEMPSAAATAEELIEAAQAALQQGTPQDPVQMSGSREERAAVQGNELVAESAQMRSLFRTVDRVARSLAPVLILGETGTGKELVARGLHARSERQGPMRSINCGALPATLLESTLFGHERGAFTGADKRSQGLFEQATGGTVFLDEVGELSPAAQAALLRVLETKTVNRVGSTQDVPVDVRVIAATHRDLEGMCEEGDFRLDLYYRLNTIVLQVPPLRDRPEELEPLVHMFLEEAARANRVNITSLAPEAMQQLHTYHWPGNVRELRNVIERAVLTSEGPVITVEDLSDKVRKGVNPAGAAPALGPDVDFKERVQHFETQLILDALRRCSGNQTEAARTLRIPIRTLSHKIRAYGIKKQFEI